MVHAEAGSQAQSEALVAQMFRKKPVEVEAVRVDDVVAAASSNWSQLPDFVADAYEKGDVVFLHDAVLIATREGHMRGNSGDWIIKGVKGELYPCKPDIFDATYDPVGQPDAQQVVTINIDGRQLFDAIHPGGGGYGLDAAL